LFFACLILPLAAAEPKRFFDIPAGTAERTLREFATQSGVEVLFATEAAAGVQTNSVKGDFAARDAVQQMLQGTPLHVVNDEKNRVMRIGRPPPTKSPVRHGEPNRGRSVNSRAEQANDPVSSPTMNRKNPLALLLGWLALSVTPIHAVSAAEGSSPSSLAQKSGTITGSVSNSATRNLLEGARIEVPALQLAALTDNTGRFVLGGVPSGTHELVVTYTGLDSARFEVTVVSGQRAVRDIELTSAIYTLQAFTVTGEREGDALALTAQRNAGNVKNVVAMDSFGNLPNMAAGEVVMRLPGIAGNPTDEGHAAKFNVRGIPPEQNAVTVDGGLLPSFGLNRGFELNRMTSGMYEQLELIKGHTPDRSANSLGGTINMKTRSPLSMKEKRRLSYNVAVRVAPPFTDQVPLREDHRAHPMLQFAYQEVFDVLGGERNLGMAVNLFYNENALGGFGTIRDFQNTMSSPAYLWSYRTWENYNNNKQASINLKTEFRYSFNTKFLLNVTANHDIQRFRRRFEARAWTGTAATVPNATTSGIVPGFTDKIVEVRPTVSSNMDIHAAGPVSYTVNMHTFDFGAEHRYGPLLLDYNAGYAQTTNRVGLGPTGGQYNFTQRLSNIGWILDRTRDDLHPRFIQTAGPDMADPNNYRPTANGLTHTPREDSRRITNLRGNALYELPTPIRLDLKTGFSYQKESTARLNYSRRWSYIGTTGLPADPSAVSYDFVKTGRVLPRWEPAALMNVHEPADPSLWREDLYYREMIKYTGSPGVSEAVTAGYVMAQGKLAREGFLERTGFITGVRTEKTEVESYGWVRARVGSTPAQQIADPVGSAERDYASTRREMKGSYTKSFPSVHLSHDITANLKGRLSWSTSFGRPLLNLLLPVETPSEVNQTVRVSNPSILPQTANNWDATLDYYFEPVGNVSIGWFHKDIRNYIVNGINAGTVSGGNDNGFNGQYEGFTLLTAANAGTAVVQGWEFSYQHQFTSLPGLLKGLSGLANYTILDTRGDFGGTSSRATGEVAGFIPRAGNLMLNWRYRGFSARVLYNFTGEHIESYSATSAALNLYRFERKTVNLSLGYNVRPNLSFSLDVNNLFNEPQRLYVGLRERMQNTTITFTSISAGVSGRF